MASLRCQRWNLKSNPLAGMTRSTVWQVKQPVTSSTPVVVFGGEPESATYRGIRPPIRARLRRQAHLCGAHVVSNYAPLLDARLPCIQTRLDALGSHVRQRIQVEIS